MKWRKKGFVLLVPLLLVTSSVSIGPAVANAQGFSLCSSPRPPFIRPEKPVAPRKPLCAGTYSNTCSKFEIDTYNAAVDRYNSRLRTYRDEVRLYAEELARYVKKAEEYAVCELEALALS